MAGPACMVTARELFFSFLRLGLTAFGGPAMVAHIKKLALAKKWLSEEAFKDGISLCQFIPGATAMQMAAYVGLCSTQRIRGALAAYTGFGLPAFLLMLFLSGLYVKTHELRQVAAIFQGLQVVIVALMTHALWSLGKNTLTDMRDTAIAVTAALLFTLKVNPFLVVIISGIAGLVLQRRHNTPEISKQGMTYGSSLKGLAMCLAVVLTGLLALAVFAHELFGLAISMMKIDLFAFGGGYSSLPLMLHEITARGWLNVKTFMDGIALGQVTPGPIVITATFVGYVYAGLAGAIIATIAVFTPSFLILVTAAPVFDRLKTSSHYQGLSKGISASFIGLLLFATYKFASAVPWDIMRVVLAAAAFLMLLRRINMLYIILAAVILSLVVF